MNFSDVAYFYFTGSLNKQNNRMWLNGKATVWKNHYFGVRFSPKKFTVYIFEMTVNQHTNTDMLKEIFGRSTLGQLITSNINFKKMDLLHIPLQWFKTGLSQKSVINLWTRKSGLPGHQTSILTYICEGIWRLMYILHCRKDSID